MDRLPGWQVPLSTIRTFMVVEEENEEHYLSQISVVVVSPSSLGRSLIFASEASGR